MGSKAFDMSLTYGKDATLVEGTTMARMNGQLQRVSRTCCHATPTCTPRAPQMSRA